ncbi:MAG: S-layer homology domain-containing protein [Firmicutes bacterium]|nr:S-layer homology domain-containing protein [Bacillota bacterium]
MKNRIIAVTLIIISLLSVSMVWAQTEDIVILPVTEFAGVSNKVDLRNGAQTNAQYLSSVTSSQYSEKTPEGHLVEIIYMKFNLGAISKPIVSANLNFHFKNYGGTSDVFLHSVADKNWNEATINFNNKPAYDTQIPISKQKVQSYTEDYKLTDEPFDITEYAKAQQNGDGIISFAVIKVKPSVTSASGLRIAKADGKRPYLEINFDQSKIITEYNADNIAPIEIEHTFPKPPFAPALERPRLFVTKDDVPKIKSRIQAELLSEAWAVMMSFTDLEPEGATIMAKSNIVFGNALKYLIYGDEEAARKAVSVAHNALATVKTSDLNSTRFGEGRKVVAPLILASSMAYDWCHDFMDEQQKKDIAANLKNRIHTLSKSAYPPTPVGTITGHKGEELFMISTLAPAIALYGDDNEMYDLAGGHFFSEFVDSFNFANQAGWHHQGTSYIEQRFGYPMLGSFMLEKALGTKVLEDSRADMMYSAIYSRRPDGLLMPDGDTRNNEDPVGDWVSRYRKSYIGVIGAYEDPYILDAFMMDYPEGLASADPDSIYQMEKVFMILLLNPEIERQSVETLPLTRYFGTPIGAMIARTGWDINGKPNLDSNVVVAQMKVGEYHFGNHAHLDAGDFEVYYKGPLAVESGMYDGYHTIHDLNYNHRTIAHNTLLVYDPDEEFPKRAVNDGGQRWPNDGKEPQSIQEIHELGYKTGEVLAYEFGPDEISPDFSYLKGDLTDAYSEKVEGFQRSFMFLNFKNDEHPAALIVFDRVTSSNPGFKKYWLLHSAQKPQVRGNAAYIVRDQLGYNGRMVNHTLLPELTNLSIEVIGGEGDDYKNGYDVFGELFPPPADFAENASGPGKWRLQVSPQTPSKEDLFLNVMQFMDKNDGPTQLPVEKIETNDFVGVKVYDTLNLFSKNGTRSMDEIIFDIKGDGEVLKFAVADLAEGVWQIEKPSGQTHIGSVSAQGGVLYFEGLPGKYKLTYKHSEPKRVTFSDIKGHWGKTDIEYMALLDIVNGVGDQLFAPDKDVTRAEFIAMVLRALNVDATEYKGSFADVAPHDWYADILQAAYDYGLIDNALLSDGGLLPEQPITREEMTSVIVRAYGETAESDSSLGIFEDADEIGDWARDYVSTAVLKGIIKGVGNNSFQPFGKATRAQAATIIKRLVAHI